MKLEYPIFLKNRAETWFMCFDSEYRFMRVDRMRKRNSQYFTNSVQYGIQDSSVIDKSRNERSEYNEHFIQHLINGKHTVVINQKEFFDKVQLFNDEFLKYQNFVLDKEEVVVEKEETSPEEYYHTEVPEEFYEDNYQKNNPTKHTHWFQDIEEDTPF